MILEENEEEKIDNNYQTNVHVPVYNFQNTNQAHQTLKLQGFGNHRLSYP